MKKVLAVLLIVLFSCNLSAQTDTTITYQGELNEAGNLANGAFNLDFSLWSDLAGGVQIGSTIEHDGISVVEGIFTVQLDFGASAFTNADRWLQITVNDVTLSPRQAVTRAPYSIQTRGMFVDADENVGIGTDTPTARLHVASSVDLENLLLVDSTAGSDSSNAIAGRTDSSSGVGVFGESTTANGGGSAVEGHSHSPNGTGVKGRNSATSGIAIGVEGISSSSNGFGGYFAGARHYFDRNVGIGVLGPLAMLHIGSSGGTAPFRIEPGSTSEHMHLVPRDSLPTGATEGDIYTNENGTIYYRSNAAWTSMNNAADFSELIVPVNSEISAHDGTSSYEGEIGFSEIISINTRGHYERCRTPYDERIAGIESGDRGLYFLPEGSEEREQGQRQFGLIGHVKLKVSAENGPIMPGDFVTCSGTLPGVGMKASRSGRVVGIAMEAFNGERTKVGLIEVYVNPQTRLADILPDAAHRDDGAGELKQLLTVLVHENAVLKQRLDNLERRIAP